MTDHRAGLTRERLFDIVTGFQRTAVLRAAVELAVFDALADGPRDATTVAAALGTEPRATGALLGALAGLGLLTEDPAGFGLAPGTRELLVSSEPGYAGGITRVASGAVEWHALADLATVVRTGRPTPGADLLARDSPYWADFAEYATFATRPLATLVADVVSAELADRSTVDILDVGCGHGLLGFELAGRWSSARVWSQDWPGVLAVAKRNADRLGLADRVTPLPGDAFDVPLGGPYDVIVVANVLFHFTAERAESLLRRLAGVLAEDGVLVVAGFTADGSPGVDQVRIRLLDLFMVAATPGGRVYGTEDYRRMLGAAGLPDIQVHGRPGLLPGVVVARKAGALA